MPAAIPVVAAVAGGAIASKGSRDAAKTQIEGADRATAEGARQYDQTRADQLAQLAQQRADQAPWLDAGRNALAQLISGTQPGGQFSRGFTAADLADDPGYQFRLQQGNQAIERSAAARGGLLSGAAAKALTRFSQGVASDEFSNAWNRNTTEKTNSYNRLASLAGVGQTAANQIGQAGQNAYGTIANAGQAASSAMQNNLLGAANARASGYVGTANAINNGIGQGLSLYQNNQLLNRLGGNRSSVFDGESYGSAGDLFSGKFLNF